MKNTPFNFFVSAFPPFLYLSVYPHFVLYIPFQNSREFECTHLRQNIDLVDHPERLLEFGLGCPARAEVREDEGRPDAVGREEQVPPGGQVGGGLSELQLLVQLEAKIYDFV